ncbi:MAG: helical backbone metal receptor, partial [Phycicoccus sp.]
VADLDDPAVADLVLLPDEPYVFTAADGPEAFSRLPARLVSGRLMTWYGPSLVGARHSLDRA